MVHVPKESSSTAKGWRTPAYPLPIKVFQVRSQRAAVVIRSRQPFLSPHHKKLKEKIRLKNNSRPYGHHAVLNKIAIVCMLGPVEPLMLIKGNKAVLDLTQMEGFAGAIKFESVGKLIVRIVGPTHAREKPKVSTLISSQELEIFCAKSIKITAYIGVEFTPKGARNGEVETNIRWWYVSSIQLKNRAQIAKEFTPPHTIYVVAHTNTAKLRHAWGHNSRIQIKV
ncbi:hypothetical protein VNO77_08791 [Canavalia gladiata]|uniref:Uncharacterized protein n=1 Tax=Canavalia gladiata TaxID=3824 RepID=A0AAN9MFD3_CANGL